MIRYDTWLEWMVIVDVAWVTNDSVVMVGWVHRQNSIGCQANTFDHLPMYKGDYRKLIVSQASPHGFLAGGPFSSLIGYDLIK